MPSDSSQEQIRKHYKKIAVLVHPDKNKQAGAEEAFKILQRSFELIGEPVRNFYLNLLKSKWYEYHEGCVDGVTNINSDQAITKV